MLDSNNHSEAVEHLELATGKQVTEAAMQWAGCVLTINSFLCTATAVSWVPPYHLPTAAVPINYIVRMNLGPVRPHEFL